jgi:tetratricopeptide (TPR) repeat protein
VKLIHLSFAALLAASCVPHSHDRPQPALSDLRHDAPRSKDPELLGEWLLGEMISTGGDATRAKQARAALLHTPGENPGMIASVALGLDDALHGRLATAPDHYLKAVQAARTSGDPRAPIIAWFAANRAVSLSHVAPGLWARWKPFVERAIADPESIGWRARSELVEWSIDEAWTEGATDLETRAVKQYGCLADARMAGPFGRGAPVDAIRAFPPENPGTWAYRWEPAPGITRAPHLLPVEVHSCAIQAKETVADGIFYVESFFDLVEPKDVLVAVQGALALRIDDALVLNRDVREWGVWPRFGASVKLAAGRHRIVARLSEPSTSIRVMRTDGTPLGLQGVSDPKGGYSTVPPTRVGEANVLSRFVENGAFKDPGDDLTRALGAFLAHVESSDDLASVMVAPLLVKMDAATGPSLSLSAFFADDDPIFEQSQATDLVRELHARAAKKDPELWGARLSLALGVAERKGSEEAVPELEKLTREFPGVPDVFLALARVYGELGWVGERTRTIKQLVSLFPTDLGALIASIDVFAAEGDTQKVDDVLARIQRLDRDDEASVGRALLREDYARVVKELERLLKNHPEKKEIEERIFDAKVRAGKVEDVLKKLETAVAKEPTNTRARLELADARYATGDVQALRRGLSEGVVAGANPELFTSAIDLVEGATALEPYRLDAMEIIRAFEKTKREMPGTAARVLDYSALWVRADGSSRMLEHEIVRLQSAEAISGFAEHRALEGLVLHMRVIKKDGTTLEPEVVSGKPTVTFPHLEVGDYIETEQVVFAPSDGRGGTEYIGPRWFFREENVGYARSEFVVISPENRELVLETTGNVPAPTVETRDGLVVRRFRVDESPAAPTEPGSAPVTEFLPSVQVGWGITLEQRLSALSEALTPMTPVDPRIRIIATHIVEKVPATDEVERSKRLYRWLLDNVEPGDESDGRRVVIGKRGNIWQGFRVLCRAVGIQVRYALANNKLAPPPVGPISRSTQFSSPVAKVEGKKSSAWLTLGNKYAPFGYLAAEVRGQPAYFLDGSAPEKTTVPEQGSADGIAFSGTGKLDDAGALTIDLMEEFSGKLAIQLRRGLSQVPEQQLHDVLESNLLAQTLRGGSLTSYQILRQDDLDAPLVIHMTVKVGRFAQVNGKSLVISPPLAPDLGRMATLPERQTPLLIGEALRRRITVQIELPKGATIQRVTPAVLSSKDRRVTIEDSIKGNVLELKRSIDIPAGRVQPAEYAEFARFAHQADDALSEALIVKKP